MSETKNLLEVNDLKMHFATGSKGLFSKEKNYVYAVDGVNFSIRPGETLGLVGESGCGKSTVARAVAQIYKPTSGEVLLDGKEFFYRHFSILLSVTEPTSFEDWINISPRLRLP